MLVNYNGKDVKLPDFFIVGAAKSGTTAMYEYLKQHPEIFVPKDVKEIHYFGSDLNFIYNNITHRVTREKYLSYFADAPDDKKIGEASVWYLYSKKAAYEIKEQCPSASIIIMLRNPVDMIYSLHSQMRYEGAEDIVDFETALDAEDDRKRGLRVPENAYFLQGLYYREVVKYEEQVRRYLNLFGKENVHIIIFDDFTTSTEEVYRNTLRFLRVQVDFKPEFKIINPNKQVRSKSLQNFMADTPQTIRRFSRAIIPEILRMNLRNKLVRLNTMYTDRGKMDQALRKRLQGEFATEVEQLSRLLGRDLMQWSK